MTDFWKKIQEKLKNNINIYVLTVVQNSGSSPGRVGFKMFVAADGYMSGSIGGGVMEYKLAEKLKKKLQQKKLQIEILKQVHTKKDKNSSGMICSGEQTVVFTPLTNKELPLITKIVNCIDSNKKGILTLTKKTINFKSGNLNKKYSFQKKENKNWSFSEQIGFVKTFYLVGAGHVALAVSKILKFLNFKVILLDNRKNLNTFELNTYADEKHIISYNEINTYIPDNIHNYIAVMTNKYTEDKLVLSKLINTNYSYLGVLGSNAKIKTMHNALLLEGITQKKLNKIYSPIGISIKSQTPEEIAISIAAEIIKIKNM